MSSWKARILMSTILGDDLYEKLIREYIGLGEFDIYGNWVQQMMLLASEEHMRGGSA